MYCTLQELCGHNQIGQISWKWCWIGQIRRNAAKDQSAGSFLRIICVHRVDSTHNSCVHKVDSTHTACVHRVYSTHNSCVHRVDSTHNACVHRVDSTHNECVHRVDSTNNMCTQSRFYA